MLIEDGGHFSHRYRDAAFLDSAPMRGARAVDIQLVPRARWSAPPASAAQPAAPAVEAALPLGATDVELKALLAPLDRVPILRLPHARGLLCGVESAAEAEDLNRLASRLLRVPQWCAKCYQPCAKQLLQWLPAQQIAAGASGPNFFCLRTPPAPAFRPGACVLNRPSD